MYQHYMTNKMKLNICSNIKIFNNEISVDIPQNYEIVDLSESDVDELQDFVLLKKHTSVFYFVNYFCSCFISTVRSAWT